MSLKIQEIEEGVELSPFDVCGLHASTKEHL